MEKIKISNLYNYNFLSQIAVSPKEDYVIFTKAEANEKENNYTKRIYLIDLKTNETFPLTNSGDETNTILLENGDVLFSSNSTYRENKNNKSGDSKNQETKFYALTFGKGEAKHIFTIPQKVSYIKQIDEENFLITFSTKIEEENKNETNKAVEGKDFYIFDELPFWVNGKGVSNKIRTSLGIYNKKENKIEIISEKFMNVNGQYLSNCNKKILFWGPVYDSVMPVHHNLFEYNIGSRFKKEIISKNKFSINSSFYFDSKIYFEGSTKDDNSSQNSKVYTIDEEKNVLEFKDIDENFGSSVGSDMSLGTGKTLQIIGEKIYFLKTSYGNSFIVNLDVNGNLQINSKDEGAINCFDIKGKFAYCIAMKNYLPQEIYKINLETGEEEKLTSFSENFVKTHTVSIPEYFRFNASENHELEGWVIKPVDFDKNKKYAAILMIHGGPKAAYGNLYSHEMQILANEGYFVFYTNPRGASGRGETFSNLVGKLGSIDYEDLMEFTDVVIKKYPAIDETRLGVSGGSYGGFMVNWMIGHTDKFKAAVSQRSISNYVSKCLTTDIGYYHNLSQVGSDPWTGVEKMWSHSPLKYVKNAKTPTLFIQSDEDYRCWVSEPLQMFTELRRKSIPSKVVLFHGENHELSRSGKPENRITRLTEILEWFKKYL